MRALPLLAIALFGCRPEVAEPVDADGDGFFESDDCNDADAAIFPTAPELCNGVDDNCTGSIDEDATDGSEWFIDTDGDGFGNPSSSVMACDSPGGYVEDSTDCNDGDADFHPSAVEADCTDANDYNCDGSVGYADADGDGHPACSDCDDASAAVNSDADEACDSIDNDCDGSTDEAGSTGESTWYADDDSDSYGDPLQAQNACDQPEGHVADGLDCNDASSAAYPGGVEACDGVDNDCDGTIDEPDASDATTWYGDADADGYGNGSLPLVACAAPTGFVASSDDCNDERDDVHPAATEVCDDVDNNCDAAIDEGFTKTWFIDYDGDGVGASNVTITACERPNGFAASSDDCDDLDGAVNPSAGEVCNTVDDDCNGDIDDADSGVQYTSANDWFADDDSDGFGDAADSTQSCSSPSGYISDDTDCDDTEPLSYPGATEVWYDDIDQDCSGGSDHDQDGDGHDTTASGGDDLNDLDATCFDTCTDGSTQAGAGDDCLSIKSDYPASVDGVFWVDPDGDGDTTDAYQAYCDMSHDGGGWTLVFHSWFVGSYPPYPESTNNFAWFEANDVGDVNNFTGIDTDEYYFMRLTRFKEQADIGTELRFESDNDASVVVLADFSMSAKYGLDGSNESSIRTILCNGSGNCFIDAPGFSAQQDNDNHSGQCWTFYNNVSWWYDDCYTYNSMRTDSISVYSGYTTDPSSQHWSWWVR